MGAIIVGLLPFVTSLFDRLIPDPAARAKEQAAFMSQIMDVATKADIAQIEVNKVEATSTSWMAKNWRPMIGMVGAISIAWEFVIKKFILVFGAYFNEQLVTAVLNSPGLDSNMWELITAMLGLGAMRSFEKIKGVSK